MTRQEQELVKWCYRVAGFSIAKLARDFEVSIDEIQRIVSNPEPVKRTVYVFNVPLPKPEQKEPDIELYRRVLGTVFG